MGKIVFLGDSITLATAYGGVTNATRFSTLIGLAAGYAEADIINAGVGGNNSADMLARLQADVIAHNPDVCVMMVGNNDFGGAGKVLTPAQYKANVVSIVGALRAAGIKPVVFSPMMTRGTASVFVSWKTYLVALESACSELSVPYVDLFREYCYATLRSEYLTLYVDTLHQTVAGNAFIAEYALRPKHAGFFIAGPVSVPDPEPAPSHDPNNASALLLALADYVLATGKATLTADVLYAKEAAQTA